MEDSILNTIKLLLNVSVDDHSFDQIIAVHINTYFTVLTQVCGAPEFSIGTDGSETWSDYTLDLKNAESVKTYIYLRVKPVFDPSTSSAVAEAMSKEADMLEWRLMFQDEIESTES